MAKWYTAAVAVFLLGVRAAAQESGYDRKALQVCMRVTLQECQVFTRHQRLTEYRQVHRKTTDGRLCAAAFVQDNVTYTDCTNSKAPDGTIGRPWCYVEVQLLGKGSRDWDYCQDVVDYDAVRTNARSLFHRKAVELASAAEQMDTQVQRLKDTSHRHREVCTSSDIVAGRSREAEDILRGAQHSVSQLQAGASKIHELQQTIMSVKQAIDRDYENAVNSKLNCEAVRGYEDKPHADGLRASFYNNASFRGPPVAYADYTVLDALWESSSPMEGVTFQDFSIRWDGYIMAPTSGKFEFVTRADCGVRVFLDGSPIIVDRMPTPAEGAAFSDSPVRLLEPTEDSSLKKTYSPPQQLRGGHLYQLRVEYFHLSALKFGDADKAIISLAWRSNATPEQPISPDYFFKGASSPPLRISGLPGSTFDMSMLKDGVLAFIDSTEYVIADVPPKYEGSKLIRTRTNPSWSDVHLEISGDANVYVAVPRGGARPFQKSAENLRPLRFDRTGDSFSVYLVERETDMASQQVPFDIYGGRVLAGVTGFSVAPGTSYFIFVAPTRKGEQSCEEELTLVSLTDSEFFSSCTSSSYASTAYDCNAGLSGKNLDLPFGAWRTSSGRGIGQYIMVSFSKPIELAAFQFKTLEDPRSWPTEISIEYPGSRDTQKITVIPGDHTYQLTPRVTEGVKATITGMRDPLASSATGGSFAFIGSPCVQKEEVESTGVKDSISIVFGGGSSGIVRPGYSLDDGSPKAAHGSFYYGWDHQAPVVNPRLCGSGAGGGGVSFSEPNCSEADKCNSLVDCEYPNSWSIDMPSYGAFRVTVEVGSPCGDAIANSLYINGTPFILNEILRPGQYSTPFTATQHFNT
ncbi:PA14 domain-containing protein [Besnoitia besnoiti]|uniref:PA14 domain-containing protein n=1 Tax=Besnoitia besnoiti TaxID=94643 RepID=A0A2A9M600_BESBE|nr:PA14 domain-containing protein [Besnoitia besnoiti]PFH33369.1 PA14 domain-containing protein [Besnoitia besnoiti]